MEVQVLCVTEHWLRVEEAGLGLLNGYQLVSSYCRSGIEHGGAGVFVKNGIKSCDIVNECCARIEKCFEFGAVLLIELKLVIICIYRPPTFDNYLNFLLQFEILLSTICVKYSKIIICGDFNIDFNKDCDLKFKFLVLINSYGINHLVNGPTRITSTTSTCIDNILSNLNNIKTNVLFSGLSDHWAQIAFLPVSKINNFLKGTHLYRNYSETNYKRFQDIILCESWLFLNDNVLSLNEKFNYVMCIVKNNFETCFPLKPVRNRIISVKPWITKGIRISCKTKRQLLHFISCNQNPALKLYVKSYCCVLKNVINLSKNIYLKTTIQQSKNRTKTIWKIINTLGKTDCLTNNSNIQLCVADNIVNDPQAIVNKFNDHFSVNNLNTNNLHSYSMRNETKSISETFFVTPCDSLEILNVIKSFSNQKSAGYDGIPLFIFKNCYLLQELLCTLFNDSISTGIFPDYLKIAKVIPLYKNKNSKLDISSYRPISLLCSVSKIFEKLMLNRINIFFNKHDIIVNNQHGFRSKRSTTSALYDMLCYILHEVDERKLVSVVATDLSKAFDSVNHELLLHKLSIYGIRGNILNWFRSYLECRSQFVEISHSNDKINSNNALLKTGVPQGSVLGPFLFLVYINDLPTIITNSKAVMYADDVYFISGDFCEHSLFDNINSVVDKVQSWCHSNNLKINMEKTQALICTLKSVNTFENNFHCNYTLCQEMKCLGVIFDKSLTWKSHVDDMLPKLSKCCYLIRHIRNMSSQYTAILAYFAYFQSIISYGLILWGSSSYSKDIFLIQKRVIRTIAKIPRSASCRQYFTNFNILTFYSLYVFNILQFVHSNKHNFDFNIDSNSHRVTRQTGYLINYPIHNSTMFEKGPFYMGIKLYNYLPITLKDCNKIIFKNHTKKTLMRTPIYSLSEFFNLDFKM